MAIRVNQSDSLAGNDEVVDPHFDTPFDLSLVDPRLVAAGQRTPISGPFENQCSLEGFSNPVQRPLL